MLNHKILAFPKLTFSWLPLYKEKVKFSITVSEQFWSTINMFLLNKDQNLLRCVLSETKNFKKI